MSDNIDTESLRRLFNDKNECSPRVYRAGWDLLDRLTSLQQELEDLRAFAEWAADPPRADLAAYDEAELGYVAGFERAKAIVQKRARTALDSQDVKPYAGPPS